MIGRHVSIGALRVDYAMRTSRDADHVAMRVEISVGQRRLPRRDDREAEPDDNDPADNAMHPACAGLPRNTKRHRGDRRRFCEGAKL